MSTMLMAILLNGMNEDEIYWLTKNILIPVSPLLSPNHREDVLINTALAVLEINYRS